MSMNDEDLRLDLKSVSFGRVGTIAVNKTLSQHTQLTMPGWKKIQDHLLQDESLTPLFSSGEQKKACLVAHHQALFEPQNSQRLNKVAKLPTKKLIHLVRDPVSHTIGWYNHIVECAMLGVHGWINPPERIEDFLVAENVILPTLKNDMIARLFYPQVEDVMLVHFHELQKEHFSKTIANIHDFCGIEHQPARFIEVQNDLTVKLLHRGMTLNLNGEVAKFTMVQESAASQQWHDDHFVVMEGVGEMMSRWAPTVRAIEGKLYIGFDQGTQLSQSTYDILEHHKAEIFGAAVEGWVKNSEQFAQQLSEKRVSSLTSAQASKLRLLIGDDVNKFVGRYPKLRELWQL